MDIKIGRRGFLQATVAGALPASFELSRPSTRRSTSPQVLTPQTVIPVDIDIAMEVPITQLKELLRGLQKGRTP